VYEWLPPGIDLLADTSAADWVVAHLRPWDRDAVRVASFMPDAFEDYARVLHPAGDGGGGSLGFAWSEVASRLSAPFHPEVQFHQLAGEDAYRHPVLGDIEPRVGSLPLSVFRSLVGFLGRWIEESEPCYFAMWDGNGTWWKGAHGEDPFDEERDTVLRNTPSMHIPHRNYFLMQGFLPAVLPLFEAAGGQSPALWWPENRSWLVSTEVDAVSSYVGGSANLIADLLGDEEVEAVPSRLDAPLDGGLA
jgi:hypothetical protein